MKNSGPDSVEKTRLLIETIAQSLVDDECAVSVDAEIFTGETVLHLHVAPKDIGKVIGSQGRMARSLRAVVGAIGMAQGVHYSLDIVEL
jgi:predicted RNA-binding protein YlqC (UPF0109 family)